MVSRRDFIKRSVTLTLGGAAGLVAACSGSPQTTPPPTVASANPTSAATLAPTPTTAAVAQLPTDTIEPPVPTPSATRIPPSPTPTQAYLAVARGDSPAAITRAAITALGGIGRFVKAGDDVIVKPNICNAENGPEYASTTNPEVVATLVTMCLEAGAKRVRVMDLPFSGTAVEAYKKSGIRAAVEAAHGEMELMSDMKYITATFPPQAKAIKTWQVYGDVLKADVLINVPIAKTHSVTNLTLALKNIMGVIHDRSSLHSQIDQRIPDLSTLIRSTLVVVDGVRVLTQNGPTGGSLKWVKQANTVIATHDIVAADAYATKLFFQRDPAKIRHIKNAADMGLGRIDVENLDVKELTI